MCLTLFILHTFLCCFDGKMFEFLSVCVCVCVCVCFCVCVFVCVCEGVVRNTMSVPCKDLRCREEGKSAGGANSFNMNTIISSA